MDTQKPPTLEETLEPKPTAELGKWYIVHTYSGHENKVKKSLHQRIQSLGFEDRIFDIIVPTRDTVTVKRGKKEEVKEKILKTIEEIIEAIKSNSFQELDHKHSHNCQFRHFE